VPLVSEASDARLDLRYTEGISMSFIRITIAAACAAGLSMPCAASAQNGNVNMSRDNMRMRDSLATVRRQRRDSVNAVRLANGTMQPPAVSERRLMVQKDGTVMRSESNGTLTTARDDSVAAENARREFEERARRDSTDRAMQFTRDSLANVERIRLETVAREERLRLEAIAMARRDSVARADSLAREEQIRQERQRLYRFRGSGLYIGVAAGGVTPTGNLKNLGYNSGANINVPIGWHSQNKLLGVRLDLGYAQFRAQDFTGDLVGGSRLTLNNNTPRILSATGNLTARLPITASRNLNLFALTGAGIYQFRSFGNRTALGGFFGNDVTSTTSTTFQSVRNKLGAQFGGGIEYGIGPVAIYAESRVVNIFANRQNDVQFEDFFGANRGSNLRWVPIMIGVNFR